MEKQRGDLVMQALAMPDATNPNGDIFGGWILSQMDLAGGVVAKRIAQGRAVTIAIHAMSFKKPVHVGDLVGCYVTLVNVGRSSVTVDIEVWTEKMAGAITSKQKVTEGRFVYVAIDDSGKAKTITKSID